MKNNLLLMNLLSQKQMKEAKFFMEIKSSSKSQVMKRKSF